MQSGIGSGTGYFAVRFAHMGTKLGPSDTANENPALLDPERQTFIQVDIESRNASWSFPVEQPLIGDAKAVLAQLVTAVRTSEGYSYAGLQRTAEALASGRPTVVDVVTGGDLTYNDVMSPLAKYP